MSTSKHFVLSSSCSTGPVPARFAQPSRTPAVPLAAQPSAHFDAKAATDAWLATVTGTARARSDAYFEGGYWLILWDFLWSAAVLLLLAGDPALQQNAQLG